MHMTVGHVRLLFLLHIVTIADAEPTPPRAVGGRREARRWANSDTPSCSLLRATENWTRSGSPRLPSARVRQPGRR
jgi:hypothetical protein